MTSPEPHAPETTAQAALFAKMAKVLAAVRNLQKRGRKEHFRYDYVQEADLMEAILEHLAANNVAFFASTRSVERQGDITTLHIEGTFACGDTGATFTVQGVGCGEDKADKGIYKAYTGAMKYVLWKTFLISTNDDPERDEAPRPRMPSRAPERRAQGAELSVRKARAAEGWLPAKRADLRAAHVALDDLHQLEPGHPMVLPCPQVPTSAAPRPPPPMPHSPRLSLATTPPAHRAASSDSLGALAPWVALLAQLTDDSERLWRCMPWSTDLAALPEGLRAQILQHFGLAAVGTSVGTNEIAAETGGLDG